MVFLCGIYSVYFTYMCLAATGLYLLFRVVVVDDLTLAQRVRRFLLGCGEILLGVGMSLVVFLPMAEVLLNVSSRLTAREPDSCSGFSSALLLITQRSMIP